MREGNLGKLHEECAVFGVSLREGWEREEAPGICYNGLLALQHRGQEGAGIACARENALYCHKDVGLVTEAFPPQKMEKLPPARQAIGHTRYSTTGGEYGEECAALCHRVPHGPHCHGP